LSKEQHSLLHQKHREFHQQTGKIITDFQAGKVETAKSQKTTYDQLSNSLIHILEDINEFKIQEQSVEAEKNIIE